MPIPYAERRNAKKVCILPVYIVGDITVGRREWNTETVIYIKLQRL